MPTMERRQVVYVWLAGLFVAALIVADLTGGRFFRVGGVDLSVGMLAFPITFVLTDVLNEFFGARGARRVTFVGLGAALFAFLVINAALALPVSPESPLDDDTFRTVFGWSRRLYVASLSAYLVGQLADIAIFGALRRLTGERLLWLRATGSTLASQLVDTVVVNAVLLGGTKAPGFIATVIGHSYLMKVAIAIGMTPVIYAAHAAVLRYIGEPEEKLLAKPETGVH